MEDIYLRSAALYGDGAAEKLKRAKVLILGVGGVGGYAAEMLARAGVGKLIYMDGDTVEPTNLNRQIAALTSTAGRAKAEVLAERGREINPAGFFESRVHFLLPEEAPELVNEDFDLAVDAIDDVPAKCAFLAACVRQGKPVISVMGAGGKRDPSLIQVADISKSFGCPLAKKMRSLLREQGITRGIPCVFSPEPRQQAAPADKVIGSASFMPAVFGCFAASEAVKIILAEKKELHFL